MCKIKENQREQHERQKRSFNFKSFFFQVASEVIAFSIFESSKNCINVR